MADDENTTNIDDFEGLEKTRQHTRDFFRAIANVPTELSGLMKAFIERSPRSGSVADPIIGAWNFYRDTFGKGEKGKINIPMEALDEDPRLGKYLRDLLEKSHNQSIQNLPDDKKHLLKVSLQRDDEYKNYITSLLDKYNIAEGDVMTGLSNSINEEELETLNTMQSDLKDVNNILKEEGVSIYPFTRHDEDEDGTPDFISFDSDFMTKVRGEPDIKLIGDRFYNEGFTDAISFPYLGEYGVDEEGKFRMIRSSAVRPFDDPGYEALAEDNALLKGPQMWEDFIAPEYSADPKLFRSPGFFAGMGASMAPMLWNAGKWALPRAGKLASRVNPYAAGIMTALQAGKAEAPTVVPEGVEATPENIEKYGRILMEGGNRGG